MSEVLGMHIATSYFLYSTLRRHAFFIPWYMHLVQINKVADAEQQWVYIEASSERGTHLFLRNGFQTIKEAKMRPEAPTIYYMGRPPKPDVPSDV